jgi:hypothetical protein
MKVWLNRLYWKLYAHSQSTWLHTRLLQGHAGNTGRSLELRSAQPGSDQVFELRRMHSFQITQLVVRWKEYEHVECRQVVLLTDATLHDRNIC